jgi:hypothetical protein
MNHPIEVVQDEKVVKDVLPEIQKLEQGHPGGFDRYIERLMSCMIPQPQTHGAWD